MRGCDCWVARTSSREVRCCDVSDLARILAGHLDPRYGVAKLGLRYLKMDEISVGRKTRLDDTTTAAYLADLRPSALERLHPSITSSVFRQPSVSV